MSREEILRRFEEWLDGALAAEEPPRGIEAEILAAATGHGEGRTRPAPAADYSLWAAMTALTQEVKLQGRSFKELNDTLGAQASRMAEREREAVRARDGAPLPQGNPGRPDRSARPAGARPGIGAGKRRGEIAKARPARLARAALLAASRGWPPIPRWQPSRKDTNWGLERLDQTLEEFNAREIPCEGQAFDPRRMNAIDREESSAVPEGTVIEVYRSGYEWNGEVFRPAQVKVSCAPEGREHE